MTNKKIETHNPRAPQPPLVGKAEDVKLSLPSTSPSLTMAGRTRLRHAAITDTLGHFRSLRICSGLKISGSMSLALTPMRSDCRSAAAQWVTQPQILQR